MISFIAHIEGFLQTHVPSAVAHAGVGHAQAWLLPERKLMIHAIPLNEALRHWQADTLLNYTTKLETQGYQAVHLWEDVWRAQPLVAAGRLQSLLGNTQRIHGRKTKVTRITLPQLRSFLQSNHLQVPTQAKFKYGLWQGEVLVGVASFGPFLNIQRNDQTYRSSELIRFCTQAGCTVVGGLSKLLQAFLQDKKPEHLMTYADRDWSQGASYERLGFERTASIPPQLFWINPHTYERHYPHRLTENVPSDWLPAYNTGSWKYELWV